MAFTLTAKNKSILNQIQKKPNVVLDIEGVGFNIASGVTLKKIRWDDGHYWDTGLRWDSSTKDDNVKNYISLKESTKDIGQQIYPDKEGSSSITTMMVKIVDKKSSIAKALSFNQIGEPIGKRVDVYLGFEKGTYPDDYMPIMRAVIGDYITGAGYVILNLVHADTLRRQAILSTFNTTLTASIDSVTTTIPVVKTTSFLQSQDALTSYIKIDEEIMEVVSLTASDFTVIRARLGTSATTHDLDVEVSSVYELIGKPLELAQKIMQSNGNQAPFESDINVKSFEFVSVTESINNAIIFDHPDIEENTGLIKGDSITVNSYSTYTVNSFGKLDDGNSYIVVDEDISEIPEVNESFSFLSQYNVLNFGLDMKPFQVDNKSFEQIKSNFSPNFIEMTFRFDDGVENARDFINKDLYFAAGCYGVPRNARSSVRFLSPPLTIEELPILDETNVKNMHELKPERSGNNFYYNDILFKFNKSILDGEFKSFTQYIDQDSKDRFNIGNKQLIIESEGFIRNNATDQLLDRLADKFLDRYKNAALLIKNIKLGFKSGFGLNVGDVVFMGGSGTNIVNPQDGTRNIPLDKYEIINQKINLQGDITVDLLSTGFGVDGIRGVYSPSSLVAPGSTTTIINLVKINNLDEVTYERDKYSNLIGCKLRIRSNDYSFDESVTLLGFSNQNNTSIEVEALSIAPLENYIIELADHSLQPDISTDIGRYIKLKHTFSMYQIEITSVASSQIFDVDDSSAIYEGKDIGIHSGDYTRDAIRVTIDSIVGNTVTLSEALAFTPQIGDKVEALDFIDQDGYVFL